MQEGGRHFASPSNASSGRSAPSSWMGSQKSLNSSVSASTNDMLKCFRLSDKDSQWYGFDREYRLLITQTDSLHNQGLGNSPECIHLEIKKKECQDEIELLEDQILRMGPCSNADCNLHDRQGSSDVLARPLHCFSHPYSTAARQLVLGLVSYTDHSHRQLSCLRALERRGLLVFTPVMPFNSSRHTIERQALIILSFTGGSPLWSFAFSFLPLRVGEGALHEDCCHSVCFLLLMDSNIPPRVGRAWQPIGRVVHFGPWCINRLVSQPLGWSAQGDQATVVNFWDSALRVVDVPGSDP
ncbi:hypothetical protein AVEN_71181-1 [Araneus ventricosus]|uniref:Uncharacterized protein n=1 Tax=Araneus ventricosus TaxID=182803 RepID=A0A4Y2TIB4_ARAVE|nr:hypothetical protein AVEN_71181-1 [Araneus ventricosus]